MTISFEAVLPKKSLNAGAAQAELDKFLDDFAKQLLNEMQDYPPWRPWVSPPSSGPHAGGRRTGAYGRGWSVKKETNARLVSNSVSYAKWVGGRQQARALKARGWKSVTDVANKARAAQLPKFSRVIWK